jgi:hypothetical protein
VSGWTKAAGAAAAALIAGVLAGCGGADMTETEEQVYDRAEAVYMEYRTATNGVLSLIDAGPWSVGDGGYGMSPSDSGCDDGWHFDLTRSTTVDPAEQPRMREAVADHLAAKGYTVEGMDLSSASVASGDVVVRKQGVYSLLTVTFVDNGNVLVQATTACQPGDWLMLREQIYGEGILGFGYLPQQEAPSDPLFFGITPGDPQFLPSPSPTP